MIGSWTIGAQLSTSHSSLAALDEQRTLNGVRRVLEALDLDLLIIGFREAPEVFRRFCAPDRPVENVYLWFSALSDITGMTEEDLVVNWRGARSRGWGGWAEKGGDVEETFRFACPNNPAVREKTTLRLRELLHRYDFTGVFLDKIRFPSPANGADEMLSCFCDHCRRTAKAEGLDLDAVLGVLADARDLRKRLVVRRKPRRPLARLDRSRAPSALALPRLPEPTASHASSASSPTNADASGVMFPSTSSRPASRRWSARTTSA